MTGGSAALAAKVCKHNSNDAKCLELGCSCIPIAVETLGVKGYRGHAYLVTRLATPLMPFVNCMANLALL